MSSAKNATSSTGPRYRMMGAMLTSTVPAAAGCTPYPNKVAEIPSSLLTPPQSLGFHDGRGEILTFSW